MLKQLFTFLLQALEVTPVTEFCKRKLLRVTDVPNATAAISTQYCQRFPLSWIPWMHQALSDLPLWIPDLCSSLPVSAGRPRQVRPGSTGQWVHRHLMYGPNRDLFFCFSLLGVVSALDSAAGCQKLACRSSWLLVAGTRSQG